jgi:hypothetical protein
LARRASKHNIDPTTANPRGLPDLVAGQTDDRPGQDGAARKIVCVDSGVDRIDLDCGHNVEARLLEAQIQAGTSAVDQFGIRGRAKSSRL